MLPQIAAAKKNKVLLYIFGLAKFANEVFYVVE